MWFILQTLGSDATFTGIGVNGTSECVMCSASDVELSSVENQTIAHRKRFGASPPSQISPVACSCVTLIYRTQWAVLLLNPRLCMCQGLSCIVYHLDSEKIPKNERLDINTNVINP